MSHGRCVERQNCRGGGRGGGGAFRNFTPAQPHGSVFYTGAYGALNALPFSLTGQPEAREGNNQNRFGVTFTGSTQVGNNVILAGQVGVAGHCKIGDRVVATAQSGIPNDVAPGTIVSGYPAIENRQWLRAVAAFPRLPELIRQLRRQLRDENSSPKNQD